MKPTKTTNTSLIFDSSDWYFAFTQFRRGDFDGDGIEDLEVCLQDFGKQFAHYKAQEPLLLSRYSAHGPLIAIGFSIDLDGCSRYPDDADASR